MELLKGRVVKKRMHLVNLGSALGSQKDGQSIVHESGHRVQNVALDVVKTLTHKRVRKSISFRSRRVR